MLPIALAVISQIGGAAYAQSSAEESNAAANNIVLEEIVVSAQRRDQSILEVPIALTSISSDALEKRQIDDIYDLMLGSPSVSGIGQGGLSSPLSNTPLKIRGVGTSGVNPGFESAVGMYVDEVYRSRPAVAMLSFYDMQGIDILRGPQGTLFGKNSTAGAIVQRTAAPEIGELTGKASLEYGDFNSVRAEGALNIPVGENSAIRISALSRSFDGFYTQGGTGDDTIAENETDAFRLQYANDVSDDLSIRLIADWMSFSDSSNFARATRFDNFDPLGLANTAFPGLSLNTAIGGLGYYYWDPVVPGGVGAGEPNPYEYVSGVSQKGVAEMDQSGLTAHINYQINDTVGMRSVTALRSVENDSDNGDWDFGPISIAGRLDQFHDIDNFSQEFLFDFEYDKLDIVAGVHYFKEDINFERLLTLGVAHGIIAGGRPGDPRLASTVVPVQNVRFEQSEESFGVFGHLTYQLTDQISLIGGARWNKIDKDINYQNLSGSPVKYHDDIANSTRFYYGRAQAATAFPWELSRSDDELTYDISLQWRPNDQLQMYGKFSHGFKAGGFSMNANAGTGLPDPNGTLIVEGRPFTEFSPENAAFDPEFVDTFEVGARWNTLLGLMSASIFTSDFSDLQLTTFVDDAFVARSVGSIDTQGFEFEGQFNVTDTLIVNAAFTVLDTEFGDDVIGVPIGRSLALAPDLSATLGINYVKPLSDNIRLTANANVNYSSDTYLNDGTDCRNASGSIVSFSQCDSTSLGNRINFLEQEAYYVVNATIGLNISDRFDVSLFCDNCFEEEYLVYAFGQPAQPSSFVGYAGAPRVYGAKLKYSF